MGRAVCAALLLMCFACTAEAVRTHVHFSQGTYYDESNATDTPVAAKNSSSDKNDNVPINTNQEAPVGEKNDAIPDRYPGGYPGYEKFNYDSKVTTEGVDPEAMFQGYKNKHVSFATVSETDSTTPTTIPDRYPKGYPGDFNPVYSPAGSREKVFQQGSYARYSSKSLVGETADNKDALVIPNRYPHGYNGDAIPYWDKSPQGDGHPSSFKANSFGYSATDGSSTTPPDRYPNGYYPGLNPTNNAVNTKFSPYQFSYSSTNSRPKFDGIPQGDFSTQSSVPFELTGGGCPTQYWIYNTDKWPRFLNVKSTVGDAFGQKATSVFGETTILQALLDTRPDGYSSLLRSGATAILNSYSRAQFKFKGPVVIERFNAALVSREAAAQQAAAFQESNVGAFFQEGGSC